MKSKKRIYNRITAILLSAVLTLSSLTGCGEQPVGGSTSEDSQSSEAVVSPEQNTAESPEQTSQSETQQQMKTDMADFVHDRIFEEYDACFETFNAEIILEDTTSIRGIGYSDLAVCLDTEDGVSRYFTAGFLPFEGQPQIPQESIIQGLEIRNLEFTHDNYRFVLAYDTQEHYNHFVRNDTYVKYGIDGKGAICYEEKPFSQEVCEETLGALYSYDTDRFLYDPNVGEYTYITGVPLSKQLDYEGLEREINRILENQDYNLSAQEIEEQAYFAQEAVTAYFLDHQQETFLGYSMEELAEAAAQLDPMECFRITPDGLEILELQGLSQADKDTIVRWTVGVCCGIAVVGCVALQICQPEAQPVTKIVMKNAMNAFMQIVVKNNKVASINWGKIAVSVVSTSLTSLAIPAIVPEIADFVTAQTGEQVYGELASKGFSIVSQTVVKETAKAANSLLDGKDQDEVWDAYASGIAVGVFFDAFELADSELGQKAWETFTGTHPDAWMTQMAAMDKLRIGKQAVHCLATNEEEILKAMAEYQAWAAGMKELQRQLSVVGTFLSQ